MDGVTVMPTDTELKQTARARARAVLSDSDVFRAMPVSEQQALYLSLVQDLMDEERDRHGLSRPFATDSGEVMGYEGYDPAFGGNTQAFTELVESVDFPKFVADLLKAVFDANLTVMKEQTDSYIKLMKEATKSSAEFIKQVGDDESFLRLAETRSDQYNVTTEAAPDGSRKLALTTPDGDEVDADDPEVKRHILEAKINMAKEHRAALREVLLMGVTRLVVDKGEIEAGVEFEVKGRRQSDSRHEDQNINTVNVQAEYKPPLFGVFGGPSGSMEMNNTNIQVNTARKQTDDTLSATLKGNVRIEFKTDYFELDNFANMYSAGGTAALQPNDAGGATAPRA